MSGQDGETGTELTSRKTDSVILGGDLRDIVSGLPKEQQEAHATKVLDLQLEMAKKKVQAQIDLATLDRTIGLMGEGARAAQQDGTAFTATNKKTDSTGDTEIVIGNTKAAHNGPKHSLFKRLFG